MEKIFGEKWSGIDFIKFISPSILGIITISSYMLVDSIFIARFVGSKGIAAVNIIMPMLSLCFGLGIMMAAGTSAIIGIELGQKKLLKAQKHFSLTAVFILVLMLFIISISKIIGFKNISLSLGASKLLLPYCIDYLEVFIFGISGICFQIFFEYFIRLDGKPVWALYLSIIGGITNIFLDYYLIIKLDMGIKGAGIASTCGVFAAAILGFFYFFKKSENLKLKTPSTDFKFLFKAMINGSSEMVTELSTGVKILVFNFIIIKYAGENGVAAMAVLMNLFFLLSSLHIGLSMGVAPVFSFNYGNLNFKKIRELSRHTIITAFAASVFAFIIAKFYGGEIIKIYLKEEDVITLTQNGMDIFSFVFLFNGINILASGCFTSVNNGKISALIAILNSFIFTLGFVFFLPLIFGLKGVWLTIPVAEITTLAVSTWFLIKYKKVYIFSDIVPK